MMWNSCTVIVQCVGQRVAHMELYLLLVTLLRSVPREIIVGPLLKNYSSL
jgi:hypothetical protein